MTLTFSKYQGTGNDFIMLDNRNGQYDSLTLAQIKKLCDRRFGIGADGLIRINSSADTDYEVDYFNSDGSRSFCGNGARCAVAFAHSLGVEKADVVFMAIDGIHHARINGKRVELDMLPVSGIKKYGEAFIADTGSPHYMLDVASVEQLEVKSEGSRIRYSQPFAEKGINVNFIESKGKDHIRIRTYERGVEDETFSCGTGATACALKHVKDLPSGSYEVVVDVVGGSLTVACRRHEDGTFDQIKLIGPAEFVFEGTIDA